MRSVILFILQTSLSVCSCPSAPPEIVRWPQTDSGYDPGWRREDCSHSRLSGPREDPDPAAESSREMVWPAGQGQRQVKPLTAKVARSGIYSLCWWQKDALMRSEKPEKYARSTNTGSSSFVLMLVFKSCPHIFNAVLWLGHIKTCRCGSALLCTYKIPESYCTRFCEKNPGSDGVFCF